PCGSFTSSRRFQRISPRSSRASTARAFRSSSRIASTPSSFSDVGDQDDGFAGDFYADSVAEAEDTLFAHGGKLDANRDCRADLDLVEGTRALEDAQRDPTGGAPAPPPPRPRPPPAPLPPP